VVGLALVALLRPQRNVRSARGVDPDASSKRWPMARGWPPADRGP